MSKRVYHLKHATPRMKYQHMRNMMEFSAALKEHQLQDHTSEKTICKVCGVNEVEASPMRPDTCYECYLASVDTLKHTPTDYTACLTEEPTDQTAAECERINKWIGGNWNNIPEVEF